MAVQWPDEVDRIIGGDMTAGLAYVTPAGGAVVTAVAPVGLRERERGTVGFTTSIGLPKKLERMLREPRISLTYHAREHGLTGEPGFVLVQGDATVTLDPDERFLREELGPRAERFMGPRREGPFWDRWLREYYADRVPVEVGVRRVLFWPQGDCRGEPRTGGEPLPGAAPPQSEPKGGTGPRVDVERAARRAAKLPHRLLAFRGADGYPVQVPVEVGEAEAGGLALHAPPDLLPPGGRRAGLLAHGYGAKLTGLAARQFTGWLTVEDGSGRALYAPHTEQGFRAPRNKTLLLLANGLLAKRGLRKAERDGTLERLRAAAG
ncbi:MAG: hypothetical protein QOD53_99 [Thermoleophilaceae bacterium]|nr:hypothetical protein [Thermoleophilaceae bacterium]